MTSIAERLKAEAGIGENSPLKNRRVYKKDENGEANGGKARLVVDGNEWIIKDGAEEREVLEGKTLPLMLHYFNRDIQRLIYNAPYTPGVVSRPECGSNNNVRPDPTVSNPISPKCSTCPKNKPGSGDRGGRACKFKRRALVSIRGVDEPELLEFDINSSSLFGNADKKDASKKNFERFLDDLVEAGVDTYRVNMLAHIDRSGNCKVLFQPEEELLINDPKHPNIQAHFKWRDEHDFEALCRMDFTTHDDDDDDEAVESQGEEANEVGSAEQKVENASNAVDEWLQGAQ